MVGINGSLFIHLGFYIWFHWDGNFVFRVLSSRFDKEILGSFQRGVGARLVSRFIYDGQLGRMFDISPIEKGYAFVVPFLSFYETVSILRRKRMITRRKTGFFGLY